MVLAPLHSVDPECWRGIQVIATDCDGTLTQAGQFCADLLTQLTTLQAAGIPVVIVTGRSAGWVSGLAHYLPIAGAIAENGGIFYPSGGGAAQMLVPLTDIAQHRRDLADIFAHIQSRLPQLAPQLIPSPDNPFRLTDWTFDVAGLKLADLQQMQQLCHDAGWGFTYSTVQCHIKLPLQEKSHGLQQVLAQFFPNTRLPFPPSSRSPCVPSPPAANAPASPQPSGSFPTVVTLGDSPNDESLFNPAIFPHSVGVANLLDYRDQLRDLPAYLCTAAEGAGFRELAQTLLAARG